MKITTSEEFGHCLRERRKELGYTQGYISDVTGLSASFISNVENGKPTSEIGKVIRLTKMLGMDILVEKR